MLFKSLLTLFKRKPKQPNLEPYNPYAHMGSLGVSPDKMLAYHEAIKTINNYQPKSTEANL